MASVGGNIIHGSPVSSLNPILLASNAQLIFINYASGQSNLVSMRDFLLENTNHLREHDALLLSVIIPFNDQYEYIQSYKQSKRRKLDAGIVCCAFQIKLEPKSDSTWTIESVCLAFGNISQTTIIMDDTQQYLKNKIWSKSTIQAAFKCLQNGQIEYR